MSETQEDFVAQGAAIGLGALFMECNETSNKQVGEYRAKVMKTLKNEGFAGARREDTVLRRQGALLGSGLLDAGGRNLALQLRSPLHCMRREATVCCFVACQLWEWYPLFNLVVKALTPSALLAVDSSLQLPREFAVHCAAAPALFEYVPATHKEEDDGKSKKSSVHFSFQQTRSAKRTLSKVLRRASTQGADVKEDANGKEGANGKDGANGKEDTENADTKESNTTEGEKKEDAKDANTPTEFDVQNGTRVTALQLPFLSVKPQRFLPVLDIAHVAASGSLPGVIVLNDTDPATPALYMNLQTSDELPDQLCPKPFVYHIPQPPE